MKAWRTTEATPSRQGPADVLGRILAPRVRIIAALLLAMSGALGAMIVGSSGSSASASSSDWPAYLSGPTHSSFNAGATSITPGNITDLSPVWRWLPPASPNSGSTQFLASPTVSDGVIYIGAKDGYFFAVDESSRKAIWSDFLGIDLPKNCGGCQTQGIVSTATVANDPTTGKSTVYVSGADGYLYALDAGTGTVVWKGLVDTPSPTVNDYYAWGSPLVANGMVYIGISSDYDDPLVPGGLIAFRQSSGTQVAKWNTLPAGVLGGSIWSSVVALADGSIIATTGNGLQTSGQPPYDESIVRLDGTTLQVLDSWQVPKAQASYDGDFGASPTLFEGTIDGVETALVGACNKNGLYYAFRQNDLKDGPVWEHRMTVTYPGGAKECDSAATWDGTNLVEGGGAPTTINGTTYPGSLQSLDPSTGLSIWETGLTGSVVGSPSENGAGVLAAPVYQSADGQLGVYLLNVATGAIIGFIPTPHSPLFGQAVFSNDDIIIGGGAGLGVTAYEITTPGAPLNGTAPSIVAPGSTVRVTVTGTGFSGHPQVFVSGGSVATRQVAVVNSTTLKFTAVASAGAAIGLRGVSVIENGSPLVNDACTSCLSIGTP
jgi:outer membrane protein assembly factor BamB